MATDSQDSPRWSVYVLKTPDGKPYFVGRTKRAVEARITEHVRSGRYRRPAGASDHVPGAGSKLGIGGRIRRRGRPGGHPPPARGPIDLEEFWGIMERAPTPEDLHAQLSSLSEKDLAAFEHHYEAAFFGSYDWGVWAAAYVIDAGCSDDGFDYFRAYLISLGREVFTAALADPDCLADQELADSSTWEDWMSPTMAVIHAKTGRYAFAAEIDPMFAIADEPTGKAWQENETELATRLPRLAAKHQQRP